MAPKLKPKKEWRLDKERRKQVENVPDPSKSACRLDSPEAWELGGVVMTAGKLRCFHLEGKRGTGPRPVWGG